MIEHTPMRAGQQSIIELRLHSVKQCDYLTGADNHSPKPMLPVIGGGGMNTFCRMDFVRPVYLSDAASNTKFGRLAPRTGISGYGLELKTV